MAKPTNIPHFSKKNLYCAVILHSEALLLHQNSNYATMVTPKQTLLEIPFLELEGTSALLLENAENDPKSARSERNICTCQKKVVPLQPNKDCVKHKCISYMYRTAPHIVQYQGSKRNLAPQILPYLPKKMNRLIEPFAGMAAISIAAAIQGRSEHYLLNDLNEPLINILREAINNPKKLLEDYTKVWSEQLNYMGGSVEHFYKIRENFNRGDHCPANMLYLLARCVKGSVRYSSSGMFNQSPDKRRMGTSPQNLSRNIYQISKLLKGKTDFTSLDYREVTRNAKPGDIVYMDPPYQGVCTLRDSRYFSGINFNDFVECVDDLNRRGVDFIISYDGICGDKQYGVDLPQELGLKKILLNAGLSSQSLLLGKKETTMESLYLSSNLRHITPPIIHEQLLFAI